MSHKNGEIDENCETHIFIYGDNCHRHAGQKLVSSIECPNLNSSNSTVSSSTF